MLKEYDEELIKAISFAQSGTNRCKVIITLADDIKMPKQIAKKLKLHPSQISATLSELKTEDIVKCLNEDAKRGRLYQLTELGFRVYEFLKENKDE